MVKFNVFDCSIIELDKHHSDRKGNITVVENGITLPFDVKRVYYLYDVPGGESRREVSQNQETLTAESVVSLGSTEGNITGRKNK